MQSYDSQEDVQKKHDVRHNEFMLQQKPPVESLYMKWRAHTRRVTPYEQFLTNITPRDSELTKAFFDSSDNVGSLLELIFRTPGRESEKDRKEYSLAERIYNAKKKVGAAL